MKIVAIKAMSAGNDRVGEMWEETKIFSPSDTLQQVVDWAGIRTGRFEGKEYRHLPNCVITIASEEAPCED